MPASVFLLHYFCCTIIKNIVLEKKIVTFSLQELRDISSMAMEYFDEKIVPNLKVKLPMSPLKINSGSFVSGLFSSGSGFSLSMRYCDTVSPPSTPLSRLSLPSASSEPTKR